MSHSLKKVCQTSNIKQAEQLACPACLNQYRLTDLTATNLHLLFAINEQAKYVCHCFQQLVPVTVEQVKLLLLLLLTFLISPASH